MKELDIIDKFDEADSSFALIATYEFDPIFFERRLLRAKNFASAKRIVVLMDHARYHELIQQGRVGTGFGRDYLVVPIARQTNVFHPKIYLTFGERRVTGLLGSANCTNAGIAYNLELCSAITLRLDRDGEGRSLEATVLRQMYEAYRTFASSADYLADFIDATVFRPIEQQFPFVDRNIRSGPGQTSIELLVSHETTSVSDQIRSRLHGKNISEILVVAPFFDEELTLLKRFCAWWPNARLTIVAQSGYSNLSPAALQGLFTERADLQDRLLAAEPKPGRRLHAKCMAFATSEATYWLTGSANATVAAFDAKNTEACFWFATEDHPETLLAGPDVSFRQIAPLEFLPGTDREPTTTQVAGGSKLRLEAVVLHDDGRMVVAVKSSGDLRKAVLRLRHVEEADPFLVLPLPGLSGGAAQVSLSEDQYSLLRSVVLCDVVGLLDGEQASSNPVVMSQLGYFARERQPGEVERDKRRKVEETGEHLVEILDGLGSVRDAIEFLNHLSIRFNDREAARSRFLTGGWKARDPFTGDTPRDWFTVHGDSVEELRTAIWDFVQRHQRRQLARHVRRGNVNGLSNFLDIFRTLNGILVTYHGRLTPDRRPIISHALVTDGIKRSIALMIGPPPDQSDDEEAASFTEAIQANLGQEDSVLVERLLAEHVPEMLRAAVEVMVAIRATALKHSKPDAWALRHLNWVSAWIERQGLQQPTIEAVKEAGEEYHVISAAA